MTFGQPSFATSNTSVSSISTMTDAHQRDDRDRVVLPNVTVLISFLTKGNKKYWRNLVFRFLQQPIEISNFFKKAVSEFNLWYANFSQNQRHGRRNWTHHL